MNALFTSNSDEWATPNDLFNNLDEEFLFTLDPCATQENHKCEKWYSITDDGLSLPWGGEHVFCNPPYSQIAKWVEKAYREAQTDKTVVVLLIPSRTDTRYFHDYIYGRSEIRFIKGRLHFNESKGPAPFPSMIVIFRGAKATV